MGFRDHDAVLLRAAVTGLNELRRAQVSTNFHASRTVDTVGGDFRKPVVSFLAVDAANATNADTLLTLVKELRVTFIKHLADDVGHKVADTSSVAAEPTDTDSCVTWLNAAKATYNTHRASTTYHYNADATNAVSSSDATDEASAITLANEMKTDLNAHMAGALAGFSIDVGAP